MYLMSTQLPYTMAFFGVCFCSGIMTNQCFVTCSHERSASFIWHNLKGYPMFLVVFKDWDSNTSENFSFAVVMHYSVCCHWFQFLTLWVIKELLIHGLTHH